MATFFEKIGKLGKWAKRRNEGFVADWRIFTLKWDIRWREEKLKMREMGGRRGKWPNGRGNWMGPIERGNLTRAFRFLGNWAF
jgi:hypothetical protein